MFCDQCALRFEDLRLLVNRGRDGFAIVRFYGLHALTWAASNRALSAAFFVDTFFAFCFRVEGSPAGGGGVESMSRTIC